MNGQRDSQLARPRPTNQTQAVLRLLRVPNLFTAAADVLAGFLFAGSGFDQGRELLILIGASVCLYAGGVALNDVFDAARDARERPNRPIPSGAVNRMHAALLASALLIAGCALCAVASERAGILGLAIAACIVLYDSVLKNTPLAPAVMGMCRAGNLLLGVSAAGSPTGAAIFAAILMWLYVASLTHFARFEATSTTRARLRVGSAGITLAVIGLIGIQSFLDGCNTWYLLLVGVTLGQVAVAAQRAVATAAPADVQRAVKVLILSLVLFDACLVFAARGPLAAALVVALIVPTIAVGKAFRMT